MRAGSSSKPVDPVAGVMETRKGESRKVPAPQLSPGVPAKPETLGKGRCLV